MFARFNRPLIIVALIITIGLVVTSLAALVMASGETAKSSSQLPANIQAIQRPDSPVVTLGPGTMSPDVVQVVLGNSVTFVNNDVVSRHLRFPGPDTPVDYLVFLPTILKANSSNSTFGTVPGRAPEEIITLAPGESIDYPFESLGNVVVEDADQPILATTILVNPEPLTNAGTVVGQLVDYSTKQPIVGARVRSVHDVSLETLTDSNGEFSLPLPPGEHSLVMFDNGYTFSNRKITVSPYIPESVGTIELVPLDETVTSVGAAGGTAANGAGNTNVVFANGALTSTKAIRLTDLPVDEFTKDFAALPGPFTDGSIPLGFVMFEPDGTQFGGDVVWTIAYTGTFPVGTQVPCYYWIEDEARWGEPVDGVVVDLGGGEKGLRATLPHFSAYGFSAPPPPEPKPPQPDPDMPPPAPDKPDSPENNPNEPKKDRCAGSQINFMSGELCQQVGTQGLPSLGGLPTQVTAKYYSKDINYSDHIETSWQLAPTSEIPDREQWQVHIAGRIFSGEGTDVNVDWDGTDWLGNKLPPGRFDARVVGLFEYGVTSGGSNNQTCIGGCGYSLFQEETPWPVTVVRNDLSLFGIGWFSPYDMLLVDNGRYVTIVQGDGRQVVFTHESDGNYISPKDDTSVLVKEEDGRWTRTFREDTIINFNADGRLVQLTDRYGNFQQVFYESNGLTIPAGEWGLTTRIHRVTDTSGNSFDFSYDGAGWLEEIVDSAGRTYLLEHDAQGHLTAFVDPLGNREEFTYDGRDMMTSHSSKRGHVTNYMLDDTGRVLERTWPTGTDLTGAYYADRTEINSDRGITLTTGMDENFNPVTSFNGVFTLTMDYDENNRHTATDQPNLANIYDQNGNIIEKVSAAWSVYEYGAPYDGMTRAVSNDGSDTQFDYDGQGNLTTMTDVLGQTYLLTYDSHGQPLTITDPLGNVTTLQHDGRGLVTLMTDPLGRSWEMGYDAAGNMTSVVDFSGRTSTLNYDLLGRVTSLVDALNGTTEIDHDEAGNMISYTDPTGRITSYEYDALNRPTGITFADGGVEAFEYDADGNLSHLIDARSRQIDWLYDDAGRPFNRVVVGESTSNYDYDNLGNVTLATVANNDGTSLQVNSSYIEGISGYPTALEQTAVGLPLTTTLDYAFGGNRYLRTNGQPAPALLPAEEVIMPTVIRPPQPPAQGCAHNLPEVITQTMVLTDTAGTYCFGPAIQTTINPGVSITVNPDVILAGRQGSILVVQGSLYLLGSDGAPVIVTSVTGTMPNPSLQNNYRIVVSGDGYIELRHTQVWFAARGDAYSSIRPQIHLIDNAVGYIENSHLGLASLHDVLVVEGNSSLALHDNILADPEMVNDRSTFRMAGTGTLTTTNNIFLHLGEQSPISFKGVRVTDNLVAPMLNGGNVFSPTAGSPSRLFVTGTSSGVDSTTTWKGLDESLGLQGLHFYFAYLTVRNYATLTIEAPQDIRMYYGVNAGSGSTSPGYLRLRGRPDAPINIYNWGSFGGVSVSENSTLEAEYTNIYNSAGEGNLYVAGTAVVSNTSLIGGQKDGIHLFGQQANLTATNLQIVGNGRHGIWIRFSNQDESVYLRGSTIAGNIVSGFQNSTPNNTSADVAYNFWGTATGPSHSGNPTGTGQAVIGDSIQYYPWLSVPGDGRSSAVRLISSGNLAQSEAYEFDAIGQLTQLGSRGFSDYTVQYEYDATGRKTARNGVVGVPVTTTYEYDDAGWMTGLAFQGEGGTLLSQSYSYDDVNNISSIISSRDGTIGYTYDDLDRLLSVDGPALQESYIYDAAGNRLTAGGVNFTYDAAGLLTSRSDGVTYGYDAAGNRVTMTDGGQVTTYTYNGINQLVRIDFHDGSYSEYRYDVEGRRIGKRLPDGNQRWFVYMEDYLAQELDEAGGVIASYTYDGLDLPVSMWRDGQTYYYLLDHLGSVLGLVDSSGTITATYQYDPWGNMLHSTGAIQNPFRLTGREFDEESGLYFYRNRYYDPANGRFLSRDPIGYLGDSNLYAYVGNNPVSRVDPFGLFSAGYSVYDGIGGGGKFAITKDGVSFCLEVGFGVGGGVDIDLDGGLAKDEDAVGGSVGASAGPAGAGAGVKLNGCELTAKVETNLGPLKAKIEVDEEGNITTDQHVKIDPTQNSDLVNKLNENAPVQKVKGVKVQGKVNATVCRAITW